MQGFRHRGTCKFLLVHFCVQNRSAKGEKSLSSSFTGAASPCRSSRSSLPTPHWRCLSKAARLPGRGQRQSVAAVAALSRLHSPAAKGLPAQLSASRAQPAPFVRLGRAGTALPCRPSRELSRCRWGLSSRCSQGLSGLSGKRHQHL